MKRNKMKAVVALILVMLMLIPAAASAATMQHAYDSGKIYLRTGPGTNYSSSGTVHNGDHITVLNYGDVWSRVQTDNGKTGYIKNLYINDGDTTYAAGITYCSRYTAYITATVNFRAGASTSTASMGTLSKGTQVKVLGSNNGFYLVADANGTEGFVSKNYVSKTRPSGTSSSSSSSSSTNHTSATTKTVVGYGVNLRSGGGFSYEVLRTVPYGSKVTVYYVGTYWTLVSYNGTTGWIYNTYLK